MKDLLSSFEELEEEVPGSDAGSVMADSDGDKKKKKKDRKGTALYF